MKKRNGAYKFFVIFLIALYLSNNLGVANNWFNIKMIVQIVMASIISTLIYYFIYIKRIEK